MITEEINYQIINRLTEFCFSLIKEIANGDTEKENELSQKMLNEVIKYRAETEQEK